MADQGKARVALVSEWGQKKRKRIFAKNFTETWSTSDKPSWPPSPLNNQRSTFVNIIIAIQNSLLDPGPTTFKLCRPVPDCWRCASWPSSSSFAIILLFSIIIIKIILITVHVTYPHQLLSNWWSNKALHLIFVRLLLFSDQVILPMIPYDNFVALANFHFSSTTHSILILIEGLKFS